MDKPGGGACLSLSESTLRAARFNVPSDGRIAINRICTPPQQMHCGGIWNVIQYILEPYQPSKPSPRKKIKMYTLLGIEPGTVSCNALTLPLRQICDNVNLNQCLFYLY